MIYMCKNCGFIFKQLLEDENDCPRCGDYDPDDPKLKTVKSGTVPSLDKSLDRGEVK